MSSLFAARWYWIVFCVMVTCCFLVKSFSSGLQIYPHGFFFCSTFFLSVFISFFFFFFFFPISFLSLTTSHFLFSFSLLLGGWGGGGGGSLNVALPTFYHSDYSHNNESMKKRK